VPGVYRIVGREVFIKFFVLMVPKLKSRKMVYEDRVRFDKGNKWFLDLVVREMNLVSLRGLVEFSGISYSSLKNYYSERRFIPVGLFEDLVYLAKLNMDEIVFEKVEGNWGQVLGGRIGKRKK
jgi:hypothetical protein